MTEIISRCRQELSFERFSNKSSKINAILGLSVLTMLAGGAWCLCSRPLQGRELTDLMKSDWAKLRQGLDNSSFRDIGTLKELNQTWNGYSEKAGASVLNHKELAKFLDPEVSIENILKHQDYLGRGAFREVSLFQSASGPVAVKTSSVNLDYWDLVDWIEDIKRDFDIALALDHPNVMKAHHFALKVEGDRLKAVMIAEYIPGEQLCQTWNMSQWRVDELVWQMEQAAIDFRSLGIVPADLHCGNVMVGDRGVVFVDLQHWSIPGNDLGWGWQTDLSGVISMINSRAEHVA